MKWIQLSRLQTESWSDPRVLIVFSTQPYEALPVASLRATFPRLQIMGMSSHHGVFTPEGFKRGSFGLLFEGAEGEKIHAQLITFDEADAIRSKVSLAVSAMPPLGTERKFIMYGICGIEERVIEGIKDVLGENANVLGATAGYDLFLDGPYVFINEDVTSRGVLFAETELSEYRTINTMAGYLPSEKRGIVTRSEGRLLYEINHLPAPEVFDAWTDGMFSPYLDHDCLLPRSAGKFPIGRIYNGNHEFGIWLTHVYGVQGDALMLYSEIGEGTEICMTRGSTKEILDNLKCAIDKTFHRVERSRVIGVFLYFCAGCTNLVAESIEQLSMAICESLEGIPFIGASTMGEQGCLEHQPLQHGNMMIGMTLIMK